MQVSDLPDYSFTVTGNRSLIACFTDMTYEITAETDPNHGGIIYGEGTYPYGETITLSVIPNENYYFQNWTEGNTIVSESASYTFCVNCPRHLVAHLIYLEGIEENLDAVEVFPNPATDKLYIKGKDIKQVTVYNVFGQVIDIHEVKEQNLVMLNTGDLKTGHYVLRIVMDQGCVSKPFVKKN